MSQYQSERDRLVKRDLTAEEQLNAIHLLSCHSKDLATMHVQLKERVQRLECAVREILRPFLNHNLPEHINYLEGLAKELGIDRDPRD